MVATLREALQLRAAAVERIKALGAQAAGGAPTVERIRARLAAERALAEAERAVAAAERLADWRRAQAGTGR